MQIFARDQKATEQTISTESTIFGQGHFGQSRKVDSMLHLQRMIGNHAVQRMVRANAEELAYDFSRLSAHPKLQAYAPANLRANPPGDIYEQEAERGFQQGMHVAEPSPQLTKPVEGPDTGQIPVPPIVHRALATSGYPLDAATRTSMESRFGHDFGCVRLHGDAEASASARAVNAKAYTVGNDIVVGEGQPTSETAAGRQLLAHELAHVVQQSRGGSVPEVDPSAPHERDALAATDALATGQTPIPVASNTGVGLARDKYGGDVYGRTTHSGSGVQHTQSETGRPLRPDPQEQPGS